MYISLIVKAPLEWYLNINSDFYFFLKCGYLNSGKIRNFSQIKYP